MVKYASIVTTIFVALASNVQAFEHANPATMTTISPIITTLALADSSTYGTISYKRLMIAAQDDAVYFIQTEGMRDKSLVLESAFQAMKKILGSSEFSDLELATALVYMNQTN